MELHCSVFTACREHPYGITAQYHRTINRLVAGLMSIVVANWSLAGPATGVWWHLLDVACHRLGSQHHSHRLRNSAATTGLLLAAPPCRHWAPDGRGLRPGVLRALDRLLHDATAGDPITGLLWTHRSMRKLAKALRRRGIKVSPNTVARLLHDAGFSLQTNRNNLAEVTDPDRDRQFRYLTRLRRHYIIMACL